VTAKSAAAHKLPLRGPVTSLSAAAGRDGRRVAPPTTSEQVLGREGGEGASPDNASLGLVDLRPIHSFGYL